MPLMRLIMEALINEQWKNPSHCIYNRGKSLIQIYIQQNRRVPTPHFLKGKKILYPSILLDM